MQDAELIKLQVMHRHGARSPAAGKVPGDNTEWYQCGNPDEFMFMNQGNIVEGERSPFMKEESVIDGAFSYVLWKGNCDAGQLTALGSHRMNYVGQVLRQVYVNTLGFLPDWMDSSFQISHTYIWRTRESVENLMAGLYPLQYRAPGQTLTMHVKPSLVETKIGNTAACPKLAAIMSSYTNSSEYAATLAPFAELQKKIVAAYNTSSIRGFNTSQDLYDTASAAYCHGLGLKGNLTEPDIQSLTIPGTSAYHNVFRSNPENATEAKTLAVGPWLQEIVASFSDMSTKLQVYSGHDASLDMFLSVVADPDLPWPPFSSSVEIELWQHRQRGKLVRMYYEGMIVPAHPQLNCSFDGCPLDTLESFLSRYIPTDLASACKV
ncbi:hypothetical protein M409DRAFT_21306 [Zasmidium cellare ATCC 36951]|uniref:3-phytase n=1 Tax=Zasmidium cellare ATCC 36951 TaxID=1080233 RepID=A0A6A6CN40_ZASCE|nr:uncharacterized protein M409DRAFT_21306 [Zasmidium cellare ATCC 36951]KAF2168555.1 hypothetical protein M409DRAFT_21306 [Zasmidium cellare ATCC 36951]